MATRGVPQREDNPINTAVTLTMAESSAAAG